MKPEIREKLEYQSLFTDERYAKKAWKTIIGSALQSSGKALPVMYDKNGNVSPMSDIDAMAYNNVKRRLELDGKAREPMQAELIVECNVLRARLDTNVFNVLLDRTAGKVKEEIMLTASQYEDLTDDELDVLLKYREERKLLSGGEHGEVTDTADN